MTGADDRGGPGPWSALAIHATIYVAVNGLLVVCWVLFGGGSAAQLGTVTTSLDAARAQGFWPMYVMVFWGAALVIHLGVVVATAPGRRRRRKARKRQARRRAELQASVVGVLPDGVLTDAAVAGIRLTDGDKAARKVQRTAARQSGGARRDKSRSGSGGDRGGRDRTRARADTGPGPEATADKGAGTRKERGRDGVGTDAARTATTAASAVDPPVRAAGGAPASGSSELDRTAEADGATPSGRRWVAVLFTDIVDSTMRNEALGDSAWAAVLSDHRALVRRLVAEHGGHEVGTQGDGFLLRFTSPDDAVRCAIAIQEQLAGRRPQDDRVPSVRMGVHAGEAVHHDGDDLVGRVVNLAARVTDAASADEILVTEPVADHLGRDLVLVDRGLRQLKGFDRPRHLLAVVWRPAADHIELADDRRRT